MRHRLVENLLIDASVKLFPKEGHKQAGVPRHVRLLQWCVIKLLVDMESHHTQQ